MTSISPVSKSSQRRQIVAFRAEQQEQGTDNNTVQTTDEGQKQNKKLLIGGAIVALAALAAIFHKPIGKFLGIIEKDAKPAGDKLVKSTDAAAGSSSATSQPATAHAGDTLVKSADAAGAHAPAAPTAPSVAEVKAPAAQSPATVETSAPAVEPPKAQEPTMTPEPAAQPQTTVAEAEAVQTKGPEAVEPQATTTDTPMAQQLASGKEPTMEEILASIRKIISEDAAEAPAPKPAIKPTSAEPATIPTASVELPKEPVPTPEPAPTPKTEAPVAPVEPAATKATESQAPSSMAKPIASGGELPLEEVLADIRKIISKDAAEAPSSKPAIKQVRLNSLSTSLITDLKTSLVRLPDAIRAKFDDIKIKGLVGSITDTMHPKPEIVHNPAPSLDTVNLTAEFKPFEVGAESITPSAVQIAPKQAAEVPVSVYKKVITGIQSGLSGIGTKIDNRIPDSVKSRYSQLKAFAEKIGSRATRETMNEPVTEGSVSVLSYQDAYRASMQNIKTGLTSLSEKTGLTDLYKTHIAPLLKPKAQPVVEEGKAAEQAAVESNAALAEGDKLTEPQKKGVLGRLFSRSPKASEAPKAVESTPEIIEEKPTFAPSLTDESVPMLHEKLSSFIELKGKTLSEVYKELGVPKGCEITNILSFNNGDNIEFEVVNAATKEHKFNAQFQNVKGSDNIVTQTYYDLSTNKKDKGLQIFTKVDRHDGLGFRRYEKYSPEKEVRFDSKTGKISSIKTNKDGVTTIERYFEGEHFGYRRSNTNISDGKGNITNIDYNVDGKTPMVTSYHENGEFVRRVCHTEQGPVTSYYGSDKLAKQENPDGSYLIPKEYNDKGLVTKMEQHLPDGTSSIIDVDKDNVYAFYLPHKPKPEPEAWTEF